MKTLKAICLAALVLLSPLALAGDADGDAQAGLEAELDRARAQLEQSAREVARLSMMVGRGPMQQVAEHFQESGRKAMLGITIGGERKPGTGSGRGVHIDGVSPGGPADEAGLAAGDVIVAMNGQSMSADEKDIPDLKLMAFMKAVNPGDTVQVRYLRDGKAGQVDVVPRAFDAHAFEFSFDDKIGKLMEFPGDAEMEKFALMTGGGKHHGGLGGGRHLELTSMTPGLGAYFGTEQGLLVVRADGHERFALQDGDVILSVDGKRVDTPGDALRRLHALGPDESASVEVIRQRQTITVQVQGAEPGKDGRVMRKIIKKRSVDPETGDVEIIIERD